MSFVRQKRLSLVAASLLLLGLSCVSDGENVVTNRSVPTTQRRVEEPEMSKFDVNRCHVHGVLLESDQVPVVFGLIRSSREFLNAQKARFPLARTFVAGGCVVDNERAQETVQYCPKCREALRVWNDSRRKAGKSRAGTTE